MTRCGCILFITGLILLTAARVCPAENRLIIASVPWRKASVLDGIYQPMIRILEERMNVCVSFFVTSDYRELEKRLSTGAADIGIFGANSYVEAKRNVPEIKYIATCMQPTSFYHSLIVVKHGSRIHEIADLTGKSFAFTDRKSTSGFIYPMLMLRDNHIDPDKDLSITYFLEKHDKVYDAVAAGSVDAGGVSDTAYTDAVARNGDVFRAIAKSEPIPRNPVVGAPHLSDERIREIADVLKSAESSLIFEQSSSILRGFSVQSDAFYDIVRKARRIKE